MSSKELETDQRFGDARGMGAYSQLFVHLVWATEGRSPWIQAGVEERLYVAMASKCRALRCPPIAVGGAEDHVHLLVSLAPAVSISNLVKEIKGSTAYLMTHEFVRGSQFRWQIGYGAFSLRRDDVPTVRGYVVNQKEHHARGTLNSSWEQTEP
jgi:REP element-mobilizing transposase RayT